MPRLCRPSTPITWMISSVLFFATMPAAAQAPVYEASLPGYTIPHARNVVVDDAGNAYLIGSAYQDGTHLDVLVAKFDAVGDPLWTRYITADNHCYATGIALDSSHDVWVTGWTDATDFPVVNAMDASLTGFRDAFLMKLDTDDGTILVSTYLGGDYSETAESIALNAADEIYLAGSTGSTDFPTTADAYQPGPSFPQYFYKDAFVAKFSAAGDSILYATYFGGTQDDRAVSIALDEMDNIVIAGSTAADDFPLVDPLQSAVDDLFVSKLSADGSTLLFSTYFGGEDLDYLGQMVLDGSGDLYMTGTTRSEGFPTTPGAFEETFVGAINGCEVPFGQDYNCEDIFVTKLSTDGGGLIWSTYLGGTAVEKGRGLAVDGAGRVYVTGYTGSADFPPSGMDFGAEIIVCRFDATGRALESTYSVDSGSANRGNGIAVDAAGDIYFTGTVGVPASVYLSKLAGPGLLVTPVENSGTPPGLRLAANVPNPFNPRTTISFELDEPATTRLRIYDMHGRVVRRLLDNVSLAAGPHAISWQGREDDGRPAAAGTYLFRLEARGVTATRRMVLLR